MPLLGPFVYARMVDAETLRRHCSRDEPGTWVHPTVVANALKFEKSSLGGVETCVSESIMPARNGVDSDEFRRVIASETDPDPADWPCQRKRQVHALGVCRVRFELYAP